VCVTGHTLSSNLPTYGGCDTSYNRRNSDGFIAKFSPSDPLIWATYLGGGGDRGVGTLSGDDAEGDWMADVRARYEDELKPLKTLVKEGRLFAVQEWLESGKPILPRRGSRHRSVVEIAANTGFQSMVEIIA